MSFETVSLLLSQVRHARLPPDVLTSATTGGRRHLGKAFPHSRVTGVDGRGTWEALGTH
jgi:hypothetical protein